MQLFKYWWQSDVAARRTYSKTPQQGSVVGSMVERIYQPPLSKSWAVILTWWRSVKVPSFKIHQCHIGFVWLAQKGWLYCYIWKKKNTLLFVLIHKAEVAWSWTCVIIPHSWAPRSCLAVNPGSSIYVEDRHFLIQENPSVCYHMHSELLNSSRVWDSPIYAWDLLSISATWTVEINAGHINNLFISIHFA